MGFVDDYKRNQGDFQFEGKNYTVWGTEILTQICWRDTKILITSDYFQEAFDKLCEYSVVMENVEEVYYFANAETEYEMEFREQYRDSVLQNIIIFRSGPHASSYVKGMDFADNARALFEFMLQNDYNKKYELVWLVKSPEAFAQYQGIDNVSFLSFDWATSDRQEERTQYYRALCLAKYIFFTDAYGFARNCRGDQIRVQLWHGCGFKTRVNFVRCEKRYEYTTVISDLYAKIHEDIYGLRSDQVLVTGYAKQDWVFHPITKKRLEGIGIPKAERYIFWLPTFRTTEKKLSQLNEYQLDTDTGLPIIDSYVKLFQLDKLLAKNQIVMVLKLHPFQRKEDIHCEGCSNIILLNNEQLVEQDIQINQLLGWADALISDYSSVAVDYMLLNRPIAFTLEDVEEYASSRGFVFENIRDWLPGKEILEFEDMKEFVIEISKEMDSTQEKRRELTNIMHKYSDDKSSKRILESLGI